MLYRGSIVQIIDNSGALSATCIGVPSRGYASVGDVIKVSLRSVHPNRRVSRRDIYRAVIVSTRRFSHFPINGFSRGFIQNGIILLKRNEVSIPLGTRIAGLVSSDLRGKGFFRILALAPEVILKFTFIFFSHGGGRFD